MIVAGILSSEDFGLVGIATAIIGVFRIFRDFGLSAAAVNQGPSRSNGLWINQLEGGATLTMVGLTIGYSSLSFITSNIDEQLALSL
jgi:O-antigen/teichoic acid export membrane protein